MSKAGKMVLLVGIFLNFLGAAPQLNAQTTQEAFKVSLNAQEKLTLTDTGTAPSSRSCSLLESYFITASSNCVEKKTTQTELVAKATANPSDETPLTVSYTVEPTYFVEPTPTITPTTELPAQPTVTSAPLQEALDLLPADGVILDNNLIFNLINDHRTQMGLPAFQKDDALCTLAKTRSVELHGELFEGKGYLHSGLYNRNLPYWITEDAKWGSNEAGTVKWWLNSPIHRRAIEGNYTYSCGACTGSQCSQLFTSYTPKVIAPKITPTPTPTPLAIN